MFIEDNCWLWKLWMLMFCVQALIVQKVHKILILKIPYIEFLISPYLFCPYLCKNKVFRKNTDDPFQLIQTELALVRTKQISF